MRIEFIKGLAAFLVLLLLQALVFNHIHLFYVATPMLWVYVALQFPLGFPKWAAVVCSFLMGLAVDVFSNTPGMACTAAAAVGLAQPALLGLFVPRDADDGFHPSVRTLGFTKYAYYSSALVLLFCLLFFAVETFSLFAWQLWLLCTAGSFVLTEVLVLAIDNFRNR